MEIKNYRKKPVVIQALKFDGTNINELRDFIGKDFFICDNPYGETPFCFIQTLEGDMKIDDGDFVIRGVNGEFYPCKPDIFEKTYEIC